MPLNHAWSLSICFLFDNKRGNTKKIHALYYFQASPTAIYLLPISSGITVSVRPCFVLPTQPMVKAHYYNLVSTVVGSRVQPHHWRSRMSFLPAFLHLLDYSISLVRCRCFPWIAALEQASMFTCMGLWYLLCGSICYSIWIPD